MITPKDTAPPAPGAGFPGPWLRALRPRTLSGLSILLGGSVGLVAVFMALAPMVQAARSAPDALLVNLSGRQRMLSQRIGRLVEYHSHHDGAAQALTEAIDLYDGTFQALQVGGPATDASGSQVELPVPLDPRVKEALETNAVVWARVEPLARRVAAAETGSEEAISTGLRMFYDLDTLLRVSNDVVVALEVVANERVQALQALLLGLMFGGLLVGVSIYLGLRRWVATPLREISHAAQRIVDGHLDDAAPSPALLDEINHVGGAFQRLRTTLTDATRMADSLAEGDLSRPISGADRGLIARFEEGRCEASSAFSEVRRAVDRALEGDLSVRVSDERFQGEYAELLAQVDRLLDEVLVPARDAVRVLSEVAGGDLTPRLEARYEGYSGRVATTVNGTIDHLSDQFTGILSSASTLDTLSRELVEHTATISGEASRVSAVFGEAFGESVAAGDAAQSVAAAAEEMFASIQEATRRLAETAHASEDARQIVEGAGPLIHELRAATEEISSVSHLIRGIAEQTNLLALNATIEAARAGEAGKGFAVVAGEVKGLASRTSTATSEIEQRVETIQQRVREVEETMRGITELTQGVSSGAGQISAAMEEQLSTVGEISRSAQNANASVEAVHLAIGAAAEAISGTTNSVQTLAASSDRLSGVSSGLHKLVEGFRL